MMGTVSGLKSEDCSIIALDKFIQATRDSGYKSTAAALSELVDNSIQAGASRIAISVLAVGSDENRAIEVTVSDNGRGMDPFTLRQSLRFGGSTRFDDRTGLGRYGMGLPNASLSQARRVTVYTWQSTSNESQTSRSRANVRDTPLRVYMTYLDVDEIVRAQMIDVPRPVVTKSPPPECAGASGTVVKWTACDRLDNRRISTIVRKAEAELARRFRHYLWKKLKLTINGEALQGFDPLYLNSQAEFRGASQFGDELEYEVPVSPDTSNRTGKVRIRFSELPVHAWHKLPNEEKRRIGISRGGGVSVVRAGREVDYGWFFMGSKNRENYDDWWRCEIQFEPVLDEAFGITHTKQQIRPLPHLIEAISPDLETTARALSSRIRRAHLEARAGERFSESEKTASERERLLKPLPKKVAPAAKALMNDLRKSNPALRSRAKENGRRYRIIEASVKDRSFFSYGREGDQLVLVINPDHPFYRDIYKPLLDSEDVQEQQLRAKLELLLLAAARGEAALSDRSSSAPRQRLEWSHALAAFLNDR